MAIEANVGVRTSLMGSGGIVVSYAQNHLMCASDLTGASIRSVATASNDFFIAETPTESSSTVCPRSAEASCGGGRDTAVPVLLAQSGADQSEIPAGLSQHKRLASPALCPNLSCGGERGTFAAGCEP